MSAAFKEGHIQSAFRATGHIDTEWVLPSIKNIVGTYRGIIDDTNYLNDTEKIVSTFYDDVFLNGRIEEDKFDRERVVRDYDSTGNYVSRDFEIRKENCQRAKSNNNKSTRKHHSMTRNQRNTIPMMNVSKEYVMHFRQKQNYNNIHQL